MASRSYSSNQNNPFFAVEDDVDDETFLRNSRVGPSSYNSVYQERAQLEAKRQELLDRRREIEERTLASSNRSITLLRESESMGVSTAEELLRQREQLERTEKRLEEINSTLRFSQKHIQGIKSVFGSLKNYFSGKSGEQPLPPMSKDKFESDPETKINSPLYNALDVSKSSSSYSPVDNHPGLRTRGLTEPESPVADAQLALDRNLEEMCGSLVRLKGLAQGLGDEIESQNDMLDRITDKTDRADTTITLQNKDMRKLLGKK